ncbi:MAG: bifunctional methylenetetrahydrofolate dehydrogenase/methenyltetrahydrofolate cyclohydrolase FolD [Proteobacteria bacterium]|nr:bifunctional methylenetetrahydrofolate dehydrogenase/methenyltetrahydrofolate cyclohydrolase FolD [Cystobacterineae bacterium]MCL2258319.1 bifunctional methylenetetrahydrofolate dehydrogenase/methenyltetrahydrofolate cyclohydrolase FolD [Cystobacterineae bacterium]MCL2314176.1 bifunctional methylenetetrahydrofolate dehydrogenase/methenyltetrahydrofolate cyclohydrolase FolD [Pseudomonadota bacterium]
MVAQLIDGKAIAGRQRALLAGEVVAFANAMGRPPGIAVIRAGEDPASKIYVASKKRTAESLGLNSWEHALPEHTTQAELLSLIAGLNAQEAVDGILVQLPLPKHLDTHSVLRAVLPQKDVDGFHPMNAGSLFQGKPTLVPCTPLGVMKMLEEIGYKVEGKRAVVIGRSNIVGRPMAALLLNASASVVLCHSKSDVRAETLRADIVVSAVGVAGLLRGDWIREGAVVVDVGMNRGEGGKLCGDVVFEEVFQKAAWLTPVPGGVGPMTIAMLMHNTVQAAKSRCKL